MRFGFLVLLLCQASLTYAQPTPDTVKPAKPELHYFKADTFRLPPPIRYSHKQLIVPAGLIISGILVNGNGDESIKNEVKEMRNTHKNSFKTKVDNYLQYSPVV